VHCTFLPYLLHYLPSQNFWRGAQIMTLLIFQFPDFSCPLS
jgi:hypothetical protein